jgi:ADP-heptose:LPS heptosyltransferase
VLHPGALGDVLLAGPALAHLAALGLRTTLAVDSRLVTLFAGSGVVGEARDLESLALHRLFQVPPAGDAGRALDPFDAVVSWFGAGDPAYRASLGRLGRPVVIARSVPPSSARQHVSRHLLDTLAPLGPAPAGLSPPLLAIRPEDDRAARSWLARRRLRPGEAIVLQAGAGSPAKAWPGFVELARRLRRAGLPVVALAGPADRAPVAALVAGGALGDADVARDWPLAHVAALLRLARAAVGNDSGPTHLAAAVGCPTVALFGPTDPAIWAPVGRAVRALGGAGSWAAVEIADVEAALAALLAAKPPAPSRSARAAVGAAP